MGWVFARTWIPTGAKTPEQPTNLKIPCTKLFKILGGINYPINNQSNSDLCQRDSELSIKGLNFKDTRQTYSEHASYGPRKKRKMFLTYLWKSPKKANLNSGPSLVRSGEIPSPRRASINNTNDCVMISERSALVRASDPPSSHHGRCHLAGADEVYHKKNIWPLV